MPGVRVFSIFAAIRRPSGKHSASTPAVRRPHGGDAGLQAGRTSQAQLVRPDGSTRGANHVLVDPGDEPCGVQLGDGVHDLQAVALLADHLLDGPRPILGHQRGQDSLWIGGAHGLLLWLEAPGGLPWARKPSRQTASLARAPGVCALGATAPGGPTRAGANYFLYRRAYSNLTRNTNTAMSEPNRDDELRLLGRALRRLRDAAGISQEELAERLQMDPTYISRIERGRRGVQWLTVQRFLRALDSDLQQLAKAIDEQKRQANE